MKKVKKVQKWGNSLAVSLSELKDIGVKRGDYVNVFYDNGRIIISKEEDYIDTLKPFGLDDNLWDEFISSCLKTKRLKKIKREERILIALEEAIRKWIKDERELFIRIKI